MAQKYIRQSEVEVMGYDGTTESMVAIDSWIKEKGLYCKVTPFPSSIGLFVAFPNGDTQHKTVPKEWYVLLDGDFNISICTPEQFIDQFKSVSRLSLPCAPARL